MEHRLRNVKIATVISVILYALIITFLSLWDFQTDVQAAKIPHFDKVVHICFYLGLNFLLLTTYLLYKRVMSLRSAISITICTIIYSIAVEFLQIYFGRQCNIWDIAANSVGSICGICLFRFVPMKRIIKLI